MQSVAALRLSDAQHGVKDDIRIHKIAFLLHCKQAD